MGEWNRQILRFSLVLALGSGLAGMAAHAARPEKPGMRVQTPRPEPIILATVMERTVPEQCLLVPREEADSATDARKGREKIADLRDRDGHGKKKVIACG
ncbi:hypothetical protein [uncultured Rhodoblastus sp.]|uniref:hypothetical protein n=1 Tax=uncultured Rhodoblastus sp. TaxID=543037 RepID=UPI0026008CF3|nr:hypothetical protein [uncultured Rhodoblastus sp.]